MLILHRHLLLTTALVAGLAAAPLLVTLAHAADTSSSTDPGFNPDTGQINPGFDQKNPTSSEPRKIPSQEEARTALINRDAKDANWPSIGEGGLPPMPTTDAMRTETRQGQTTAGGPETTNTSTDVARNGSQGSTNSLNSNVKPATPQNERAATTGSSNNEVGKPIGSNKPDEPAAQTQAAPQQNDQAQASQDPAAQAKAMQDEAARAAQRQGMQSLKAKGPIGSTAQTMPAKLSERNDILDRVPVMALPLPLSEQDRRAIYQAVMADKSQPEAGADSLKPAAQLPNDVALDGTHALPESLQGIALIKGLSYVKAKDKVFLVSPATRIVVDEIAS